MAISGGILTATSDLRLAALSVAVSLIGSYTAIDIAEQIAVDRNSRFWIGGSGLTLGLSIWAMHFTAILAHKLPTQVSYNFTIVLISMGVSIFGSTLGFLALTKIRRSDRLAAFVAGLCVAITILALHYCAMQSLQLQAMISYEPKLAIASSAIAVVMSTLSFLLAFRPLRLSQSWSKFSGAMCMGIAISGMHYVAMRATIFRTASIALSRLSVIDNTLLAIVIGIAAILILILALIASFFGRKLSAEAARAEVLRQSESRLEQLVQQRTQELKAEKLVSEAASQAKTEFLSYVSHELRTPLSSIISFSNVLQQQTFGTLSDKQKQYVGIVHECGQHLLELINDLLDLSKIEAGQEELLLENVAIAEVCQSALSVVREQAEARGLELNLEISPDLTTWIVDKRRLRQILLNLLANAVNYTEAGFVTLRVTRSSCAIQFAVIDTGIGISDRDQARLFLPFQQVGNRSQSGTGLGLALSRKLARLHGGDIICKSTPGVGSCFTLELPACDRP